MEILVISLIIHLVVVKLSIIPVSVVLAQADNYYLSIITSALKILKEFTQVIFILLVLEDGPRNLILLVIRTV